MGKLVCYGLKQKSKQYYWRAFQSISILKCPPIKEFLFFRALKLSKMIISYMLSYCINYDF